MREQIWEAEVHYAPIDGSPKRVVTLLVTGRSRNEAAGAAEIAGMVFWKRRLASDGGQVFTKNVTPIGLHYILRGAE